MVAGLLALVLTHVGFHWATRLHRATRSRQATRQEQSAVADTYASIIVPAWNEAAVVGRCISSLKAQTYRDWECIIVASGSDNTAEAARKAIDLDTRFRVIEQSEPGGKNKALNTGLRMASGQVIVLLDADSIVGPSWLENLLRPVPQLALAVTGSFQPTRWTRTSRYLVMKKIQAYQIDGICTLNGAGSIALHRSVMETIGDLPEDVYVGVDYDLDRAVTNLGVKKWYAAAAEVTTELPSTLRDFLRTDIRWRRGHLRILTRRNRWSNASLRERTAAVYFYALSALAITLPIAGTLFWLAGLISQALYALTFSALLVLWATSRELSLAVEVALYTKDRKWLREVASGPFFLIVSFVTSIFALIPVRWREVHFKGPRGFVTRNEKQ